MYYNNSCLYIFLQVNACICVHRFWQRFQSAIPDCDIVVHVCDSFTDLYSQIDLYSQCFNNLAIINGAMQVRNAEPLIWSWLRSSMEFNKFVLPFPSIIRPQTESQRMWETPQENRLKCFLKLLFSSRQQSFSMKPCMRCIHMRSGRSTA